MPKITNKSTKSTTTTSAMVEHRPAPSNKKVKVTVTIVSVIVGLVLIISFLSGWAQFGIAYVQCGHAPVILEPGTSFAGGSRASYYTTDDFEYYNFSSQSRFFCSTDALHAYAPNVTPAFIGIDGYDAYYLSYCHNLTTPVTAYFAPYGQKNYYLITGDQYYNAKNPNARLFCNQTQAIDNGFVHMPNNKPQ
jgi:hypothetical protein